MNSSQALPPHGQFPSGFPSEEAGNQADYQDDQSLSAYDYLLPEDLIAQRPVVPRDSARLLVVHSPQMHTHQVFRDLPRLLQPGDLLVLNNTRVIPARLYGRKPGGAAVEVLLLEEKPQNQWLALVKPGRRLKPGAQIEFMMGDRPHPLHGDLGRSMAPLESPQGLSATVIATDPDTNGRILQFDLPENTSLHQVLNQLGHIPLPPYITTTPDDPEQYQTIYGDRPGAVAAPTAGLHFTPELLQHLHDAGIHHTFITLHVGVGTFRPVEVEDITTHAMHEEWVDVPNATVEAIQQAKVRGGRIIAVGTTVVRALEAASQTGEIYPYCGKTNLFIYPGYRWRVVEGLMTNFHLPKSSLLMLVSALIGRPRLLNLYQEAIAHRYRFYSFGDAMLILPSAKPYRS